VPAVPEIRLFQAHPGSGLARFVGDGGPPPYWAYDWAGGIVLARYILRHPESVRGRRVVDLGTGSGLVAIAAVLAGAASVTAVDIDPLAVVAARLNAAENAVAVDVRVGDGLAGSPPEADVVTAGDLFYDPDLAERAEAHLGRCAAAGLTVLVGDPGRRTFPAARLRRLAVDDVPDFERRGAVPAAVYTFD
jgi:predicted nicotinamide N-methyase